MKYNLDKKKNVTGCVLYDTACEKVDAVIAELNAKAATEALNSNFLGRFFVSIADVFIGTAATLKSNLVNISKSLKRSELHEFVSSNHIKIHTVDLIPYDRLVGFKVNVPANFQGTYVDACSTINKIYLKLNTLNVAKLMQTSITGIFKSITNEDSKTSALIRSAATVVGGTIRQAKPTVLQCQHDFSGKFEQKAEFDNLFLNKNQFVEAREQLLNMEPRLQEAHAIQETVETMEQTLKSVCQYLQESSEKLTQQDIALFGELVKNAALIMDGYQLAVTRQMSLEHNYVLMVNAIYDGVK